MDDCGYNEAARTCMHGCILRPEAPDICPRRERAWALEWLQSKLTDWGDQYFTGHHRALHEAELFLAEHKALTTPRWITRLREVAAAAYAAGTVDSVETFLYGKGKARATDPRTRWRQEDTEARSYHTVRTLMAVRDELGRYPKGSTVYDLAALLLPGVSPDTVKKHYLKVKQQDGPVSTAEEHLHFHLLRALLLARGDWPDGDYRALYWKHAADIPDTFPAGIGERALLDLHAGFVVDRPVTRPPPKS